LLTNTKYIPVVGETYTLFGDSDSTDNYYRTIKDIVLLLINDNPDIRYHIKNIRLYSRASVIKRIFSKNYYELPPDYEFIRHEIEELKTFTVPIKEHFKSLPYSKYFNSTISALEYQYHLYMIEIELTNILNKEDYLNSKHKIALLPHCLRENIDLCKAKSDGTDYLCTHCKKSCYVGKISTMLEERNITPYIWLEAELNKLVDDKDTGILGMACVVELTMGLRRCDKKGIPAVGIPLNANRCRRWMGDFYPTSVNLEQLEKLIS
jgi:hypothetical protein